MTKRQQSKKQKLPKIAKDPNEYLEAQRRDHQSHLQAWTPSGGICGLIYTSRHPTLYQQQHPKNRLWSATWVKFTEQDRHIIRFIC